MDALTGYGYPGNVRKVLEKHDGNVSRAAAALDVSRNTVLKYAR